MGKGGVSVGGLVCFHALGFHGWVCQELPLEWAPGCFCNPQMGVWNARPSTLYAVFLFLECMGRDWTLVLEEIMVTSAQE